ncbi:uncharacterized protein VTP21DRAFT_4926 [Calcarisporiella thermophila]|uniref:uncharacterized protein n=1 Tax=Calcarisporiella thermophila TaxID=911321 RepID=UPI003743FA25
MATTKTDHASPLTRKSTATMRPMGPREITWMKSSAPQPGPAGLRAKVDAPKANGESASKRPRSNIELSTANNAAAISKGKVATEVKPKRAILGPRPPPKNYAWSPVVFTTGSVNNRNAKEAENSQKPFSLSSEEDTIEENSTPSPPGSSSMPAESSVSSQAYDSGSTSSSSPPLHVQSSIIDGNSKSTSTASHSNQQQPQVNGDVGQADLSRFPSLKMPVPQRVIHSLGDQIAYVLSSPEYLQMLVEAGWTNTEAATNDEISTDSVEQMGEFQLSVDTPLHYRNRDLVAFPHQGIADIPYDSPAATVPSYLQTHPAFQHPFHSLKPSSVGVIPKHIKAMNGDQYALDSPSSELNAVPNLSFHGPNSMPMKRSTWTQPATPFIGLSSQGTPNSFMSSTSLATSTASKARLSLQLGHTAAAARDGNNRKFKVSSTLVHDADALALYRQQAEKTQDPDIQLSFAKCLLEMATSSNAVPSETRTKLEAEAVYWVERLASKGHGEACYLKGMWHYEGRFGVIKSADKAKSFYLTASKQNVPLANYALGRHYEANSLYAKAITYYKKGAALGNTEAGFRLAMMHLFGEMKQPQNFKQGMMYLKIAAKGATEACPQPAYILGLILADEYDAVKIPREHTMPDDGAALSMFSAAASLGYGPALIRLGRIWERGELGLGVDIGKAVGYYREAAEEAGEPDAMLSLSRLYLEGSPEYPRDEEQAFYWCQSAANLEYPTALYALGYLLEVGIGCEPNMEEAKTCYERAAEKGSEEAKARLRGIGRMTSGEGGDGIEAREKPKGDCVIS